MRVALDTSFARRGPSGTATYVELLAAALREHTAVEVVELSRSPRRRGRSGGGRRNAARSALNLVAEAWWTEVALPRAARRAGAHVLHHPLPAWSRGARLPQVVTVHDAAFERLPERFDRAWVLLAGRRHRRAAAGAAVVVAVSEHARRDAVEVLGAAPGRVIVAPHGPGQPLPRVERAARPAHFLYVGDDEPRKDLPALLAAYAEYRDTLTVGEGRDSVSGPSRAQRVREPSPGPPQPQRAREPSTGPPQPLGLVLAGAAARLAGPPGVTGEPAPDALRLAELHAGAAALVHPSLDEGFGLTLAEAMTVGTPVVAVRNRGVEDVFGDAALLVEPDAIAPALTRVATDANLCAGLAEAGRARVAGLTWEASARAHEVAYTLAVEGSPK